MPNLTQNTNKFDFRASGQCLSRCDTLFKIQSVIKRWNKISYFHPITLQSNLDEFRCVYSADGQPNLLPTQTLSNKALVTVGGARNRF